MSGAMMVRHYVAPMYLFEHPKGGDPYFVLVVNRKRGMPPKGWRWEGKLSLFGGGANPGEDRLTALRRELGEELPFLSLDRIWDAPFVGVVGAFPYTITLLPTGSMWSQGEAKALAGGCEEGVLDWIAVRSEADRVAADWAPDAWVDPKMPTTLLRMCGEWMADQL